MNKRDIWEQYRAENARIWLNDPLRELELKHDKQRRSSLDIKLGHLPACGLLVCHPKCKRAKS